VNVQILSGVTDFVGSSFSSSAGDIFHSDFNFASSMSNIDVQVYLESLTGSQWTTVAKSASSQSSASVDFTGTSAGTYRWRISITNSGASGQQISFTFRASGPSSMTFTATVTASSPPTSSLASYQSIIQVPAGETDFLGNAFSASVGQALHSGFTLLSNNANINVQLYLESLVGSQWNIVAHSLAGQVSPSVDFTVVSAGS
jgi:hypothetical protein